jgi:hypothetical protein
MPHFRQREDGRIAPATIMVSRRRCCHPSEKSALRFDFGLIGVSSWVQLGTLAPLQLLELSHT